LGPRRKGRERLRYDAKQADVFCFFFSKNKDFLSRAHPRTHPDQPAGFPDRGVVPGLRHASMRVFMALALLLAALGGGLYWMSSDREFRGRYVPAQWQNGRVVPAHLE
jgi:hypothetical protein